MKRLIVYDLDGTLVDTREDIAQAVNHMLGELDRPPMATPAIARYVGLGLEQLIRGCLATDDAGLIERGMRLYRAHYTVHLVDRSALYPGVRDALEHFAARRQAVLTNKPNPFSRMILEALGVAGYFVDIVGGNSHFPKKPDPEAMRDLMARVAVSPDETLLVGDSPIDVETGRRARVFTVGVAQGFAEDEALEAAGPNALVRNFQEFLALARREQW